MGQNRAEVQLLQRHDTGGTVVDFCSKSTRVETLKVVNIALEG